MREKMMNFMRGRYGMDSFSNFLMWTACFIIFINMFIRSYLLNLAGLIIFIYAYVRIFSRNYVKRSAQNTWFLARTAGIRKMFTKERAKMRTRRTHHIYSCPSCKQKIRIPKGKGRVEITCPKCGNVFVKRS